MSALTRNKITLVYVTACHWLILSASTHAQFDAPPPPPSLSAAVSSGETAAVAQVEGQSELQEAPPALPVELQAAPATVSQAVVVQKETTKTPSLARRETAPVQRSKVQSLAKTRSPAVPTTARRPFISRLIRSRQSRYPYGAPLIRTTVALPKVTAENPPKIELASKLASDKKSLQEKFGSLPIVTTKAELKSVAARTAPAQQQQVQPVASEPQESKMESVLRQPAGVVDPVVPKQVEPTADPVMAFAKPIRDPGADMSVVGPSIPTVQSPAIQLASYEEVPVHSVSQPVTCSNGCCDLAPAGAPLSATGVCDGSGCDAAGGCHGGTCGRLVVVDCVDVSADVGRT